VRVHLPHQPRFELGQSDARGCDEQVRQRGGQDDVGKRDVRLGNRIVGAAPDGGVLEERDAAVGLRVQVDEQRLAAAHRERGGKIHGGRGLADAPFLIGDGDDHFCGYAAILWRSDAPILGIVGQSVNSHLQLASVAE
jgi:hypothetical protein